MTDKTEKSDGRKTPFSVKFAVFIVLVAAVIFLPSTVVFCVCMLPTFVAALVDRQPHKTLWITIGALNLAGTVPAWFTLWQGDRHINSAVGIVSEPVTLLIAYGGAAAGWVIHQNVTPLVASLMIRKNEARIKDIDRRHKELIRKWGEDVSKTG